MKKSINSYKYMKFNFLFILLIGSCTNTTNDSTSDAHQSTQKVIESTDTSILSVTEKVTFMNNSYDLTIKHFTNNQLYLFKNDSLIDSVVIHNKHVVPNMNEMELFAEYIMLNSEGHFSHDDATITFFEPLSDGQYLYSITDLSWCDNYFLIDLNAETKIKNLFFERNHKDCLRITTYKSQKIGIVYFGSNWIEDVEDTEVSYGIFNLSKIQNDSVKLLFNKIFYSSKYADLNKSSCKLSFNDIKTIITK